MTIVEKPNTLSLSQNMKRFIVSSVNPINFVLKKGGAVLLTQRYVTNESDRIEIDVKDIIHASLRYQLRESGEVYEQPELAADFTAVIDETEVHFRVVRGGVAHLEDAASTFLQQNWLTWQPTEKKVTYYSPEFLTYYAVADCVVKLKAYFSGSDETITYASLSAGKAYTLPLQYAVVSGKFKDKLPGAYDVWVETAAGERLTYVQRYRAEAAKSLQEDWVLFENSLGGLDSFRAYGEKSLEAKHTHNVAELDDETEEYRVDTERIYTKHTGYLSKDETKWLLDFFPSTGKYIFDGNVMRKITVTESSAKMSNQFDPCGYSFSYQFAEAVPLLNLTRAKQPLEVLNIEIPEVGNFTIPPRLAEVGRLPLSEGVLFPVQNPYAENWGTTTMGAIAQVIGQLLGDAAGSGGGVGHQHQNIDLLNLLAMAGQYLTVDGKKIHAGYADEAGSLKDGDQRYVRKDVPESLQYLLRMLGGAEFGKFSEPLATRTGAAIDADGNGMFTTLSAKQMHILTLIMNKLTALAGDFVMTDSGEIEHVELVSENTYRLSMVRKHDNDITDLEVDDVLRASLEDLTVNNKSYVGWYRVLAKNTQDNTLTVAMYAPAECEGNVNYPPVENMIVHHWGNATNKERQRCWYISSPEGRIVYLTGVYKPKLETSNYASFYGLPVMLDFLKDKGINPDEPYLWVRGLIAQDIIRVDYQGNVEADIVDRGLYDPAVAKGPDPYLCRAKRSTNGRFETHDVWANSCRYRCLKSGTHEVPKWNAVDWVQISGDTTLHIELEKPNGDAFVEVIDCPIVVHIFRGVEEITEDVSEEDIAWSRDTGDPAADLAWPSQHLGEKKCIRLRDVDCPKEVNRFTVTAFVRDGEEVYEVKAIETIDN